MEEEMLESKVLKKDRLREEALAAAPSICESTETGTYPCARGQKAEEIEEEEE